MKYLRATFRSCALCVITLVMYFCLLAGTRLLFVSMKATRRWRQFCLRAWARSLALLIGMQCEVRGTPPPAPFLLVVNHLSYIDIIALAAQSLDCVFIAKSEVASWPVIGCLCQSVNTIFIDRKRRRAIPDALASIQRAIEGGTGVVLFAEGTSTPGGSVAPFKSSLLELAARARLPVHYASVSYRTPPAHAPAHRAVCWWGEMTFLKHLFDLLQLPEFHAQLIFGAQPIAAGDRKALAAQLWSAIRAQFTPVVGIE